MPDEISLSNNAYAPNSRPELSAKPVDKRPLVIGIIVAIVIVAIFAGSGWFLFTHPETTAVLRDIFIIFLGLGAFVVILLLVALIVIAAYLVLKVNDLVRLLDREIKPMLAKLNGTLHNVQGTTNFLTERAVQPVISTASNVAAIRTIVRSLFRT